MFAIDKEDRITTLEYILYCPLAHMPTCPPAELPMEKLISILGLFTMLALAWMLSENRRRMDWRLIGSGLALQMGLGLLQLHTRLGQAFFSFARAAVDRVIGFSNEGARFIFGDLVQTAPIGFSVLPMVVFVSSITGVLFTSVPCNGSFGRWPGP